jgi:hypothetical protein
VVADDSGLTDKELDAALTEIDRGLRQESEIITGRELRGWFKLCQQIRLSADLDHPLASRTFEWFRTVYGERLNVDMDLGMTVVDILGDLYRLRCIRIYGTVYAVCSPALTSELLGKRIAISAPGASVNLLDCIESLTPDLAGRFSVAESANVLSAYWRAFTALSAMQTAGGAPHLKIGAPYVNEALDDLTTSVASLFNRNPNYGHSNWASLQAAEKIIKSYILEKGGNHKNSHRLAKDLLPDAYALGLPLIDPLIVEDIQCEAEVRYDATLVSKKKALAAHYATLTVCGKVAPYLRRTTAQWETRRVFMPIAGFGTVDALVLAYAPPTPPFIIPRP